MAWASSDVECGYWSTHRWMEPVADLVRQAVQEDMEQSGLFRAVFLAENSGSADLLLAAEIHRFGERDRPDGWYAEAVVTFEVSRVRDGIVLYHRRIATEEKCDAPLVKEVVLALGRALQRMGEQVRADVRIVATPEDDR